MQNYKKVKTILNLKYELRDGMKSWNCLMDYYSVSELQDYFKHNLKT